MKTIYMDITSMLQFPGITGIQRVVGEVAVRLIAAQKNMGYQVILLRHNRDFSFTVCDNDKVSDWYMRSKDKGGCLTSKLFTIDQLEPNSFWLDVDGVWVSALPRHLLYPQLAKRNVEIGIYVHDVIAVTHPHYVSEDSWMRFPPFLGAVFDYADIIFTNTEFTKQQIQMVAQSVGCVRPIRYCLGVPGGDFTKMKSSAASEEEIAPVVAEILEKGKILLTVSTLEIRKNHKVLLDAFDSGLSEMGYQMVFVGKTGWKVDELMERIASHPENGKNLFHLTGLNDISLQYLYENAQFVLFSSYIEGFGLATVEALRHGVPTILSDVPVMREVGGDCCDYFEPDKPSQLVGIIKRYEDHPEEYFQQREKLIGYQYPTWDQCVGSILECILESRKPILNSCNVEQIVYLSARSEALLETIDYVERFMGFIKKALVFCPEVIKEEINERYHGRLVITCVTDGELLQGRSLPEDHAYRNYFLRCLAISRPEVDHEFIMSDDDYRPMERIDESFFVRDSRYQAYYFYDLDQWGSQISLQTTYDLKAYDENCLSEGKSDTDAHTKTSATVVVRKESGVEESPVTSYDLGMMRTNQFLKEHGYPNLQYASHMPQIIRKEWFQDMLRDFPRLECLGLCEWTSYFNYAIKNHPESFDVRPYVTMAWPERFTSWDQMVIPKEFVFENYYDFQYEDGELFGEMSKMYHSGTYLENAQKKLVYQEMEHLMAFTKKRWRTFENQYSSAYKVFPSFVCCYGADTQLEIVNPPLYLEMVSGYAYGLEVFLMKQGKTGEWNRSDEDIRIGYCYEGGRDFISAQNMAGNGRIVLRIMSPGGIGLATLNLFYSMDGKTFDLICRVPVRIQR